MQNVQRGTELPDLIFYTALRASVRIGRDRKPERIRAGTGARRELFLFLVPLRVKKLGRTIVPQFTWAGWALQRASANTTIMVIEFPSRSWQILVYGWWH
jgi:hypothetical protein